MPTDDIDVNGEDWEAVLNPGPEAGETGDCLSCQRYEGHEDTVIDGDVCIVFCNFGSHGKTHYTNIDRPLCGSYIEKIKADA